MKKRNMATPFKNPHDGIFYFRREVPEKLRAAFDDKREVKVSLGTRDPAEAKAPFARENAKFEERLTEARRRDAEGTLILTPGGGNPALVRSTCGRSGPEWTTAPHSYLYGTGCRCGKPIHLRCQSYVSSRHFRPCRQHRLASRAS